MAFGEDFANYMSELPGPCGGSSEIRIPISRTGGCSGSTRYLYISDGGSCGGAPSITVDSSCSGRESASQDDIVKAFSNIRKNRR